MGRRDFLMMCVLRKERPRSEPRYMQCRDDDGPFRNKPQYVRFLRRNRNRSSSPPAPI